MSIPPRRSTIPAASGTTKVMFVSIASHTKIAPARNCKRFSGVPITLALPVAETAPACCPTTWRARKSNVVSREKLGDWGEH
jgi:hypothetical protein